MPGLEPIRLTTSAPARLLWTPVLRNVKSSEVSPPGSSSSHTPRDGRLRGAHLLHTRANAWFCGVPRLPRILIGAGRVAVCRAPACKRSALAFAALLSTFSSQVKCAADFWGFFNRILFGFFLPRSTQSQASASLEMPPPPSPPPAGAGAASSNDAAAAVASTAAEQQQQQKGALCGHIIHQPTSSSRRGARLPGGGGAGHIRQRRRP